LMLQRYGSRSCGVKHLLAPHSLYSEG
jgi:hypothetical protein